MEHMLLFIERLIKFIDEQYLRLTRRGGFSSQDAWNLLAKLIQWIFEDMALVWAEAWDIGSNLKDLREYTMAMVLWVTLKMHEIMNEYMDHNFEHHPSVTLELVQFLVSSLAKTSSGTLEHEVSMLKGMLAKQEVLIKAHAARIDSLTSQMNRPLPKRGRRKVARDP